MCNARGDFFPLRSSVDTVSAMLFRSTECDRRRIPLWSVSLVQFICFTELLVRLNTAGGWDGYIFLSEELL